MKMTPLYSIIIPVFNSEKYLKNCLVSISNQKYDNFECIVIDDGSTDNSLKIARDFEKDKRFKIFHQENTGVSSARNFGITKARGEYIIFVDSDDTVTFDFFEKILRVNTGDALPFFYKNHSDCILKVSDFLEKLDSFNFLGAPWGKIFKRNILLKNSIFFPTEIDLGEDLCFFITYLLQIDFIHICNYKIYNYTERETSLCHNVSFKRYIKTLEYFYNFIISNHLPYESLFEIPISCYILIFERYRTKDIIKAAKLHKKIRRLCFSLSDKTKLHLVKRFGKFSILCLKYPFILYLLVQKLKQIFKRTKMRLAVKKHNDALSIMGGVHKYRHTNKNFTETAVAA